MQHMVKRLVCLATVAGDVTIGSAASIDLKGKGYQSGCSAYGTALIER